MPTGLNLVHSSALAAHWGGGKSIRGSEPGSLWTTGLGEFLGPFRRLPLQVRSWRNQLLSWLWRSPFCFLFSLEQAWFLLLLFSGLCYIRILTGEWVKKEVKELLGRRGSQRSTVGVVLWVRSPTSSASGEAVEPEIVAEAKIGTYKSAELDLRPAACPPAQRAGPGSRSAWAGSVCHYFGLPPSFPHTFWD